MNLKEKLLKNGIIQKGHFKLSSGFHSNVYINKDSIYLHPNLYDDILDGMTDLIVKTVSKQELDAVVGLEKGSIPLAGPVGIIVDRPFMYADKKGNTFTFRKNYAEYMVHKNIILIEDIVTTGKSLSKAMKVIESLKGKVTAIFCIWNRSKKLEKVNNINIYSLIDEKVDYWDKSSCLLCKRNIKFTQIK
jgi:orotate phosphoribosyltransferase